MDEQSAECISQRKDGIFGTYTQRSQSFPSISCHISANSSITLVLSIFLDSRPATLQHGLRSTLVCPPYATTINGILTFCARYCLNTLFAKAYGEFSVNVQGLSRVSVFCPDNVIISDRLLQGMFPLRAFYWGHRGARDNFSLQIRNIVEAGYKVLGEKPVIIGECGVPMDMKYVLNSRSTRSVTHMGDGFTARARHSRQTISSGKGA